MSIELKVPSVGESITEVQIGEWRKAEGDWVRKNESLVEIETDKATIELPAPADGLIAKVLKRQGDRATVGEVIGYFDEQAQSQEKERPPQRKAASEQPPSSKPPAPEPSPEAEQQAPPARQPHVMPAARRALATHGLAAEEVTPTGPGGRMLKEDVEAAATGREKPQRQAEPIPAGPIERPLAAATAPSEARGEKVVPMTMIRRRIAERLVEAQRTAALLTTFNEVDMTAVIELRKRYRETFEKKHGVKLGFMSFFVRAAIDALQAFPAVNAEIRGTDVVYHNYYDVGIAVGSGRGLVVPVLRDADRLSFSQIELAIADFARRAQENKLELHELQGGTFTISNGGVYGSMLSTPIINPPQSGILGLHAINDRPVARDGQVVIRPMMYLALTYDHRIVDGREAVTFLRRIKEVIEDPNRLLLEI
jgi:2-oxoglutarate dehydrogenase E2 component (dihydrolipoamide succinyltransferase)